MGSFDGIELDDLVLTTDRLTLRPWQDSDAPALIELASDPDTRRFLPFLPDPYDRAAARSYIDGFAPAGRAEGHTVESAMVETVSGRLVGSAALRLPTGNRIHAVIGYMTAPWARGNGFAAEASARLADFAHEHGVGRVEIICDVQNLASARTALKAGFSCETVLRGAGGTLQAPADNGVFVRFPGDKPGPLAPRWPDFAGLSDGVVALRALDGEDADKLIEQDDDPVSRQWGFVDAPIDEGQLRRGAVRAPFDWLVGNSLRFAILDARSRAFAGNLDVRTFGPPGVGLIGYTMHPSWRGRGYTARALRLVTPWLFEHAGFGRLELGAKIDNVASQKSAAAGGYLDDGIELGRLRNPDGSYSDEARFYLLSPAVD